MVCTIGCPKPFLLPLILFTEKPTLHLLRVTYTGDFDPVLNILSVLRENNIGFSIAMLSSSTNASEGQLIICVDLEKSKIKDVNNLLEELRKIKEVKEVDICKTEYPNLILNTLIKPMISREERAIINHARSVATTLDYLYQRFPVGGKALIYYAGFRAGIKLADVAKEITAITEASKIFEIALYALQALGYGIFRVEEFSEVEGKLRVTVKVDELIECEAFKGKKKNSQSQLVRGMIAGIASRITNKRITCKEVKCVAKGDPYCQFIVEGT